MPVTRGQCEVRPTVAFLAARHHRPLAGTKLYCLVTEAAGIPTRDLLIASPAPYRCATEPHCYAVKIYTYKEALSVCYSITPKPQTKGQRPPRTIHDTYSGPGAPKDGHIISSSSSGACHRRCSFHELALSCSVLWMSICRPRANIK